MSRPGARAWPRAAPGLAVGLVAALGACADPHEPVPPAASESTASDPGTTSPAADDTDAPPRVPAPLVEPSAWVELDAADDPIPDHRPPLVECGSTGAYVEGNTYEIDTARCNYLARRQPSRVEVRAGDRVAISAYHATLASEEAGQAHLALLLGGSLVWQQFIPIPAYPGVVDATPYQAEVVVDVDVPQGTPVDLHLHNHGYNTWTLLEVELRPGDPP